MALARGRRERSIDYWPGFVDALSTLILGIIFLLTVFAVMQFFLTQEMSGKDTALTRLNAQIAQLTELLSLEKTGKANLEALMQTFRSNLATTEAERDRYRGIAEGAGAGAASAQGRAGELSTQLDNEKQLTARALSQVELLNQQISALRRQRARPRRRTLHPARQRKAIDRPCAVAGGIAQPADFSAAPAACRA